MIRIAAPSDDTRVLTRLAAAGLAVTALLAVFGLPPVDLHGPLHYVGIMDPLCGGTRALRLTGRGDLAEAWRFNPLGPLLVAGAVALVVRHAVGRCRGRWLALRPLLEARLVRVPVAAGIVVLWINQQLNAGLLRGR